MWKTLPFVIFSLASYKQEMRKSLLQRNRKLKWTEMELNEFEFKSAKTRFKFSAGLNLETFDTILSGTNHI